MDETGNFRSNSEDNGMVKEIIENIEREAGIEGREKKIIELIKRLITLRCN